MRVLHCSSVPYAPKHNHAAGCDLWGPEDYCGVEVLRCLFRENESSTPDGFPKLDAELLCRESFTPIERTGSFPEAGFLFRGQGGNLIDGLQNVPPRWQRSHLLGKLLAIEVQDHGHGERLPRSMPSNNSPDTLHTAP